MKLTLALVFILSVLAACKQSAPESLVPNNSVTSDSVTGNLATSNQPINAEVSNSALIDAFKHKKSDIFVQGAGAVKKLLADDNKGARHQKFLLSISPHQTLLFAHNIDLAPRVENLQVGDEISFRGEYVYNPKGGVVHWTHHDPSGRQENNNQQNNSPQGKQLGGWIKHNGKIYE